LILKAQTKQTTTLETPAKVLAEQSNSAEQSNNNSERAVKIGFLSLG